MYLIKLSFSASPLVICCALMSFCGCFPAITPMMSRWPIVQYPSIRSVPVEAAYITTNYDTIEGYTKMDIPYDFPIIPKGVAWLKKNVRHIPIDEVTYMQLYDYDFDSHFYEFRRISYYHLYRLVAEKGNIKIYDNFLYIGSWKNRTLLVEPKDTIQLFGWFAFTSHFGNKRPLLLKFINRRYHVKLREKDFKTRPDMIQYILDKENDLPGISKRSSTPDRSGLR
jgi:hypothetical protein